MKIADNTIAAKQNLSAVLDVRNTAANGQQAVSAGKSTVQTSRPAQAKGSQRDEQADNNTQAGSNAEQKALAKELSTEELQAAVQDANKLLQEASSKQLSFFVDEETGKQGVRIVNAETREVIKQIPPEELLNLTARLQEQVGALLDQRA